MLLQRLPVRDGVATPKVPSDQDQPTDPFAQPWPCSQRPRRGPGLRGSAHGRTSGTTRRAQRELGWRLLNLPVQLGGRGNAPSPTIKHQRPTPSHRHVLPRRNPVFWRQKTPFQLLVGSGPRTPQDPKLSPEPSLGDTLSSENPRRPLSNWEAPGRFGASRKSAEYTGKPVSRWTNMARCGSGMALNTLSLSRVAWG
jgi:hypothetical protein